jgi:hypothetical protein
MSPSAKLVSLATAVPPNVLSQSDVAAAANQCFGGRYDEFERLARVFKSSVIRRRHAVRPIDWYLTPLGWPERATVYLEGACELFVDAAKQQGARSYERASCSRSCCLSSERTRQLVQGPLWQARHATPERVGTSAQNAALLGYRKDTLAVLAAMLAVVTLARMLRGYREKRVGTCYSVARLLTPGKPYQTKVAVR